MSHFSFTRNTYDKCALDKKEQESADPGKWVTDASVIESKEACFLGAAPFQHNPFKSVPSSSVDIDIELRGQTRDLSKCPSQKYNPNLAKPIDYQIKECADERLVPEYTRVDKPCNIFSGITINRFHPLCEDVQTIDRIHSNTFVGSNTRLQIKDTFKEKEREIKVEKERQKMEKERALGKLIWEHDMSTPCPNCAYVKYN